MGVLICFDWWPYGHGKGSVTPSPRIFQRVNRSSPLLWNWKNFERRPAPFFPSRDFYQGITNARSLCLRVWTNTYIALKWIIRLGLTGLYKSFRESWDNWHLFARQKEPGFILYKWGIIWGLLFWYMMVYGYFWSKARGSKINQKGSWGRATHS